MSEEDDWFERALRDIDEESDRSPDDEPGDGEGIAGDTGDGDTTEDTAADTVSDTADGDTNGVTGGEESENDGGEEGDRGGSEESDPFGGTRDRSDGAEPGDGNADPGGDGSLGDGSFDDDSLGDGSFGDSEGDPGADVAEAFDPENYGSADPDDDATESFGGGGGGPFGDGEDAFGDGEDAFGGADGEAGNPFGGGTFGEDDPFGGYRGNASSQSGDFGFGEFGGGGSDGEATDFDVDPDEFDSSIERTDIGIEGLDDMILGGVPRRSLLSVIGGAGTGKTTFALQFLNEALESGGKGIYITLEQTRESILSTASEKGWSFREHAAEDRLAVVAIDPIEMANSLASIRNDLTRLIAEFDADRLVLDSVSLLEMMYDHPAKRRSEVFGFTRSLKEAGVTTLLTSEASEENPYASRHGIVEYLTDAVFVLQYIRGSDFRETRLAVEIQKIRDANHSRETKPYEITDTGISVYGQANIF
jgi:KaiC domain protein